MNIFFTTIIYVVIGYVVIDNYCQTGQNYTPYCFRKQPPGVEPIIMEKSVRIKIFSCFYPLGVLTFILLQVIDNCISCCYNYDCCNNCMIPFTQRTVLDIDNPKTDGILYLKELKDKSTSANLSELPPEY